MDLQAKKVSINGKIEALGNAERITKKVLGELSRELIDYVFVSKSNDIDAVNRTLNACTPVNRKVAVMFFAAFLPFQWIEEEGRFAGLKKKQIDKKLPLCIDFLASDKTIWDWAEENVKVEQKEIDYLGKITKAVEKALKAEKGAQEVFQAVLAGGLNIDNMMALLEAAAQQVQEEMEEEKKAA